MQNSSIGVFSLLGLVFVALKLTGYIKWSWWFVTMPFWIQIVIFILIVVIFCIYRHFKR
ncbi:MAG: hypothetical protein ACRCYA_05345 [Cetobacterium sp.]|uniref:hypothetical protein n=1 Tax=Cetobacterium sp. TaxID=2071632 RepID=UPI003EE623B5